LTFQDAQQRLLAYVRERIHNGELTERGFARMLGVSQPHVHNVLKGVRNLSTEISDSILRMLQISILDLATAGELERNIKQRSGLGATSQVRWLSGAIGPGLRWPAGFDRDRVFRWIGEGITASASMAAVRLAYDPDMFITLRGADVALIDTSEAQRGTLFPDSLYVVERAADAVVRHVRPSARGYYQASDTTLGTPERWDLTVRHGELSLLPLGRVLWAGSESDADMPLSQRGRFFPAVISS